MSDGPAYYTTAELMQAANRKPTQFRRHLKANVGGIRDARERYEGIGYRFKASKCRNYLELARKRQAATAK